MALYSGFASRMDTFPTTFPQTFLSYIIVSGTQRIQLFPQLPLTSTPNNMFALIHALVSKIVLETEFAGRDSKPKR